MPNSIYTLYVGLDHGGLVGLFGGGDLQLQAGGSTVASLSGNSLLSVLNPQSGMQTVSLSFQTGPTAPSGNIGIFFRAGSLAGIGGNVFLDNFQLNSTPVPEPNSGALSAAFGFTLLLWCQRSRRARTQS